jgi:hypothetical protein
MQKGSAKRRRKKQTLKCIFFAFPPRFIHGVVKSTALSLSKLIVKSAIAMSAICKGKDLQLYETL